MEDVKSFVFWQCATFSKTGREITVYRYAQWQVVRTCSRAGAYQGVSDEEDLLHGPGFGARYGVQRVQLLELGLEHSKCLRIYGELRKRVFSSISRHIWHSELFLFCFPVHFTTLSRNAVSVRYIYRTHTLKASLTPALSATLVSAVVFMSSWKENNV